MKGLAWGLLTGVAAGMVLAALAGGLWWYISDGERDGRQVRTPQRYTPRPLPESAADEASVSDVIYLNREGAVLIAGNDDASVNRSSVVRNAGKERVEIPPFQGSFKHWRAIVKCVRRQFSAYDVRVVDRRPVNESYVMAVVGGKPADLGAADGHAEHRHRVTGLAPFGEQPVPNAVALVFSRALRRNVRKVCETAAMEIAHTYGLDHTRHCRDVMSYKRPCGRRRFLDRSVPCGEHEDRACKHGSPTQNSHAQLIEVLGAASKEPGTASPGRARR